MKPVVTHRSFYDQFMDQWRESPTYTVTILVVLPIAMAINGLHAVVGRDQEPPRLRLTSGPASASHWRVDQYRGDRDCRPQMFPKWAWPASASRCTTSETGMVADGEIRNGGRWTASSIRTCWRCTDSRKRCSSHAGSIVGRA
jgi:hypothetical protein